MTPNQNQEQLARDNIDAMLLQAGWAVQDLNQLNLNEQPGVAVREFPTDSGPADYVLFVDREPLGVIEAKKAEEGHRLTIVEEQSGRYAQSKLKWVVNGKPLRFIYESTGTLTRFTDANDPVPRSREIFHFHQPETLKAWSEQSESLRGRFKNLPELKTEGLRDCQINAITNLDKSFKEYRPKALIQMATGSGKTFTAITFVYRLLKYARGKRILFLVDTKNLGEQAEQEFMNFTPNDDNRKFTELYAVQRLKSSSVPKDNHVYVSTIQRMYSVLRGEELDESAEEISLNEIAQTGRPKEVAYNPKVPVGFFDFIVIDECHRSIYNLWKQVLDYFDAFQIGLTATPDKRTFGYFNENVVSEYTHEQAVADGVNVGFDVFTIETKITKEGSKLEAKEFVDKRDRLTRRSRWEQLDEDVEYSGTQLDRDIVNPSQIHKIIRTFRDQLPQIFPNRTEVPKTLIFAKTDSHADDIIRTFREEFAEGNRFCKKVTYNADEDPKTILASFRNEYHPRIAVTVDMIATGTDVKPLECLLFMRDVKSRNYFEQMKGRGTRTLDADALKKVTPSAPFAKTHFVIVDAVGVCKSMKTDSRPLERDPSRSLKDLLYSVMLGAKDEDTFLSLANRLTRLDRQLTPAERRDFKEKAGGKTINAVVHELLDCHNPDAIEDEARRQFGLSAAELPTDAQRQQMQDQRIKTVAATFTGGLNTFIETVRRSHEQIMDNLNLDELQFAGWDAQAKESAEATLQSWRQFIAQNRDEITALKIFYDQPWRQRELTFRMIRELNDALQRPPRLLSIGRIWHAYAQIAGNKVQGTSDKKMLTDLITLLRYELKIDPELAPFADLVNRNFRDWVFRKNAGHQQFTDEQMEWLRLVKDHIVTSVQLEKRDLDNTPFAEKGGLMRFWKLFGEGMEAIIEEMNEALAA
jgi:type I restriction enzyme, R subunit